MGKLSPEEFLKKHNPSKLTSVADNRAGGAGSVALPANYGESQYDSQAARTDLSNLDDFRGEVQPFTDQLANGIGKALPNTAIRVADSFATTLGAIFGIGKGIVNLADDNENTTFGTGVSDGINNSASQFLDGLSKDLGEAMPIYRTDEYEDAGVGKILQSPFWTDTMTDAASFMASSIIGGGIVSKGISSLGKGMAYTSKAKEIINGLNAGKNLGNVTKSTEMWKNLAASTFGAVAESGVEARETYNTIYNNLIRQNVPEEEAKRQASSASNISMLTNMILVGGSNFLQFGKHFTNLTDDVVDAAKITSEGSLKGYKVAAEELTKAQKAYKSLGILGDPLTEASQEGGQFAMSKFLENYYTGDDEERDNFLKSTINAMTETFSPDGIESMMAGFVLGGLGSAGKKIYDKKNKTKTEDDYLKDAVSGANSVVADDVMSKVFGEGSKILASQMSRSMEADKALLEAKRVNDEVGAGLIKASDFGDLVTTRLRLGKFDEVMDYLNGIKESDAEQVNDLYNTGGTTRINEETKNTLVDNAISQANKIKEVYDANTRRYGRIVSEDVIAKMSVAESILDYAKVEELKSIETFKKAGFDINEVLSKYKTPEEMKVLGDSRTSIESAYNSIKSDIDTKRKEGTYKGERSKELESTFNELSRLTNEIENSLSDASFTTPFSVNGESKISNYKTVILKEINKKLNSIEQASERNAGDLTEWQKLKDARDSFMKVQSIKDGIIDMRNSFVKDPKGFEAISSEAVIKSKASKAYKDLFKIKTQPHVVIDDKGKAKEDPSTSFEMGLKPGLYYEGQGRVQGVIDKDGKPVYQDGKKLWKNLSKKKRDFYDVLETFIQVGDNGIPEPMVRYMHKGVEKTTPLAVFKTGVLNPVFNNSEIGNVISEGLMTEEEAFYIKYRNNVIQYQYKFKDKDNKVQTEIVHGMLGFNAQGYMVVRFKDSNGFVKDTKPFTINVKQEDGTTKSIVKVSSFQAAETDKRYSETNSQYLKILSEEESKEWLFLDNLERTRQMFENTLNKRNETKSKNEKLPFEETLLTEEAEIKKELNKVKESLVGLDGRTKEAKAYKRAIDRLETRLSNISSYLNSLENEIKTLEANLQLVNDIIKSGNKSESFYNDLKSVKESLNKERQDLIDMLEHIETTNTAFKESESLYYSTLSDIREQFADIIDFEKFYDNPYLAEVITAMNDAVLEVKYDGKALVGSDFAKVLSFMIDNNDTTLKYVGKDGNTASLKIDLKAIESVGNEDFEDRLAVLEDTIAELGDDALQLMAKLRASNRSEYANDNTISTYDFYKTVLQRLTSTKNSLTKDDTIYYGKKNITIDGYNDPFIASPRYIKDSDRKSIYDSISTTSPGTNESFPSSGTNEQKHQWIFQKFLADNDLTDGYLMEYLTEDITDTAIPYTREDKFDNDPTQKAILVRIVDNQGNPVLFDNTGKISKDGTYQAITTLEAGSKTQRVEQADGSSYTKFREVDELLDLKTELTSATTEEDKAIISSKIANLEKEIDARLESFQKVRTGILSVLDKGERFITKPIEQSLGVALTNNQNSLVDLSTAFGDNYKKRIENGELIIEVIKKTTHELIGGSIINARVGSIIIYEKPANDSIKKPKILFLEPNKNNDYAVSSLIDEIRKFAAVEEYKTSTYTFKQFYDVVRRYVYWGSVNDINKEFDNKPLDETKDESDEELKNKMYHIRFEYGSNSQVLEYGDYIGKDEKGRPLFDIKKVAVKDLVDNEDFAKFIKSKNAHFSSSLLNDSLIKEVSKNFLGKKLDNQFKVRTQPSYKLKYQSQYLRGSNEQVLALKEKVKKEEVKNSTPPPPTKNGSLYEGIPIEIKENPTVLLSNTLTYKEGLEQIALWFESGVLTQLKGETIINFKDLGTYIETFKALSPDGARHGLYKLMTQLSTEPQFKDGKEIGEVESSKYDINSIEALNRLVQYTLNSGTLKFNNVEEEFLGEETGQPISKEEEKKIVEQASSSNEDGEVYMRKTHNLDAQPKMRVSSITSTKDLNRYFGLNISIVPNLIDGVGFGKVQQVFNDLNDLPYLIQVTEDAPIFAEYHEKFHLAEKFIFNDIERQVIYNRFRAAFNNNNLTDSEVSEMMAEEFRYYSIERTAKENKSFMEKIYEYLTNVIDGLAQLFTYNSSPEIKALFDAIYDETLSSELFKDTKAYNKSKVYELSLSNLGEQSFTREEIKSLQKHTLLSYYNELAKVVPNFSHFSFLSDKEYAEEVKEEYKSKMDALGLYDNADTVILLNTINSLEVSNPFIKAKLTSYENRLDLAKNISEYINVINQNGIDIDEYIKETINEEFRGKDTAYDLEPTQTDFIKGGSSIVNMLLATIPGEVNHLGLTEHLDINKAKVELHYLLEKIKDGVELNNILRTSDVYWHNVLYSRLTTPRLNKEGGRVFSLDRLVGLMQIVTNFKKQIVNFVQTNVEEDGKVTLINKNRDALLQRELYNFSNSVRHNFGIDLTDFNNDAKIIEHKQKFKNIIELDDAQFLNRLGFEVSPDFIKHVRNNKTVKDAISGLKYYTLVKTKDIKEFLKKPEGTSRIKTIAEAITDFKNEVTPVQVLSADNKPMYAIIERNFISKKLQELQERFEDSNINEQKQIKEATIVYNLGVTTTNEAQKANKLSEKPSYIMHINNMLHNISPFIATGDKSSYFGFRNLVKMYEPTIVTDEIHDRYIRLYKDILEQEFNTFLKYKSADEDVVLPFIAKHFGVSDEFSKGLEEKLFVDGKLTYLDFNSFYSTIEEGFSKAVVEYTEKKVQSLWEKLIDNGVVLPDGTFAGIDTNMANTKNVVSGYTLAHKLHLFILESNYIQSKYLVGDLGYYGMNLNKRVPTAMATKKDGNYTGSIADLLATDPVLSRGHQFKFNKKIGNDLVFDALIHDDLYFNDKELGKLFKNYTKTNIADGAAMEHIESIRFREIVEGTWTTEDESLYQLDLDSKLPIDSLVKWTMKKTQYFGDMSTKLSVNSDNMLTVPTLYKMAVLPITNAIAKESKTLRDIKKLMEDNQIPLLAANSANKITRVSLEKDKGYKLFNDDGSINQDVDRFKQTSYWKYYNTQQETHKDENWEQTQGTQFSKQIFANILEGDGNLTVGENTLKARDVIGKIDEFNRSRAELATEDLYERLGISKEKGGIKIASTKSLLKEIKANLQQKDVPSVMIEEVIELLSNNKGLDTVLNSTSFEAVLTSLVNKLLIQPKKFGMSMAQAANVGFTQMEFSQEKGTENIVKLTDGHGLPPLKAYISGESDGLEVYLPNYLKESIDISRVDAKLLNAIGFRIPTQGANSIERIIIKGFLPASYGNMVIVPSSITTKSGSDFDIDKLNIYLPSFYTDSKGNAKYSEILTDENSTLLQRYGNYVKRNVKGTKGLINSLKESSEYKEYLDSIEKAYERILAPSKLKLSDIINSLEDAGIENSMTFYELPSDIQAEFKEYNTSLNLRGVKGLEKQQAFSNYTEIYLMNNKVSDEIRQQLNALKATYDIQIELVGGIVDAKTEYSDSKGIFTINKSYLTDGINKKIFDTIAEFNNLESIDTFSNRSILNQNNIQAIDNGIFEQYLTILDSKEYRKQMLTPNSDEVIQETSNQMRARDYTDSNGKLIEPSIADLMTIEHHIDAKQGAQLGKNILGQVALHSTHHILSQMANLNVSVTTPIFEGLSNLHKGDVTNLDIFRDTKGGLISDSISELVNAAVDVLKDPYIKYSEITEHNAGTFLYLVRIGVPLREVVHFFNNPVIREYNRELAKRQFNSTEYNSQLHKDVINSIAKKFDSKMERVGILGITSLEERALAKTTSYDNNIDYTVLQEFDKYFKTATVINDLMRTTKFDTSGMGTSFGETKGIVDAYEAFIESNKTADIKINNIENIFTQNGVNTTMGVYRDVVKESISYFDSLYSANSNPQIRQGIDDLFKTVKEKDKVIAYNKYISDFATYITQSYSNMPKWLRGNGKDLSIKSVARILDKIKADKKEKLHNNLFINTLVTDLKGKFDKVLLLQGSSNTTNKYYSEQLSDSFKELMQIDANLGNDLIKLAILQDGFSKSPFSYLHLIPIEYKINLLDNYYSIVKDVNIGNFNTKFKLKNYKLALGMNRVYKPEKFSTVDNGYIVGPLKPNGFRDVTIKINKKVYHVVDETVKELDMTIGRSVTDYISTPIETEMKPATMKDLVNSITDRYALLEPKKCNI